MAIPGLARFSSTACDVLLGPAAPVADWELCLDLAASPDPDEDAGGDDEAARGYRVDADRS